MIDKKAIHVMFYENGKTKDRKDPSKRVTRKVQWSKSFESEIVDEVLNEYKKTSAKKFQNLSFIANMAYCGLSFVESIECWAKISNKILFEADKKIVSKSKDEIFSLIGYLCSLKRKIEQDEISTTLLCEPVFKFTSFEKILKTVGIEYTDSKILCRAKNFKKILKKSLGYYKDITCVSKEKLEAEINLQIDFFTNLAKNICFDADEENFVIHLLRYDLKKCKN